MRRFRLSFVAVSLSRISPALAADPTKLECIASNETGQDLRQAGKLLDAREKFASCIAPSCPGPVREDCVQRLADVDDAMPSILFEVRDSNGNDVSAVHVTIDGQPPETRLDGTPVRVDPGAHTFIFDASGSRPLELSLVLREGDKERHQQIELSSVAPSPPAALSDRPNRSAVGVRPISRPAISPLIYAALGTGVVGLAIGIGAGIAADNKYAALKAACSSDGDCPSTAQGDLSGFHSLRSWSTAGYVVGAVGLAGGTVLWLALTPRSASAISGGVWLRPDSAGLAGAF